MVDKVTDFPISTCDNHGTPSASRYQASHPGQIVGVVEYKQPRLLSPLPGFQQVKYGLRRDEARHLQEILERNLDDLSVWLGVVGSGKGFSHSFSLSFSQMREPLDLNTLFSCFIYVVQ